MIMLNVALCQGIAIQKGEARVFADGQDIFASVKICR